MLLDPHHILREPSPDEWERVSLYAPLIKTLGFHRFGCCQGRELLEPKAFDILSSFKEDPLPNLRMLKRNLDMYPHLSIFFPPNVKLITIDWQLSVDGDSDNIPFVKSLKVTSPSLQSLKIGTIGVEISHLTSFLRSWSLASLGFVFCLAVRFH
jgi:hypothetical protein